MNLLGIDIETGGEFGRPLEENFITELGFVVYDTEYKNIVHVENYLLDAGEEVSGEAVNYTGITTDIIKKYGVYPQYALEKLARAIKKYDCKYYVAHNGLMFDIPLLKIESKRYGEELIRLPLIDSMLDVPYPSNFTSKNLTYLAAVHSMLPGGHRALFDATIMLQVMEHYDLEYIIERAKSPFVKVAAETDYPEREKPKRAGFKWSPEIKKWTKTGRAFVLQEEKKTWDFTTKLVAKIEDIYEQDVTKL